MFIFKTESILTKTWVLITGKIGSWTPAKFLNPAILKNNFQGSENLELQGVHILTQQVALSCTQSKMSAETNLAVVTRRKKKHYGLPKLF